MEKEYFRKDVRRIGEVLLLFLFLQLQIGFGLSLILSYALDGRVYHSLYEPAQGMIEVIAGLVSAAGSYYYGKARLHINPSKEIKPFPVEKAFSSLAVAFFLSISVSILLWGIKTIWTSITGYSFYSPDFSMSSSIIYNVCLIVSTLIIAPIFEELIFRGLILRTLVKYNTTIAILVSSVAFGMMHMNFEQAIPTMALGMLFGYVSLKYDSLALPIVLHFLNNLISLAALNIPGLETIISYIELVLMFVGAGIFFSEWKQVVEKYQSYTYTSEVFKQWTIIVFGIVFVIFGISSLFG